MPSTSILRTPGSYSGLLSGVDPYLCETLLAANGIPAISTQLWPPRFAGLEVIHRPVLQASLAENIDG